MGDKRLRVYVAGPYSGNNILSCLQNIGRGEKVCAELFKMGFAPFCPWHDKSYVIDNPDTGFSVDDFYKYSIAWLEVSNVMLVLENWADSYGTTMEINKAKDLKIPVFYSIEKLIEYSTSIVNTQSPNGESLYSIEDLPEWARTV